MAMDRLNFLYQEVLFDHTQHPHNKKKLENSTHHMELLNPSCGDMIQVEVFVEEDIIKDIGFTGEGCTISMASASMMTDVLMGQTIENALKIIQAFNEYVGVGLSDDTPISEKELEEILQDAALLVGVKQFPARHKCATLAWKATELGLQPDREEKLLDGFTLK